MCRFGCLVVESDLQQSKEQSDVVISRSRLRSHKISNSDVENEKNISASFFMAYFGLERGLYAFVTVTCVLSPGFIDKARHFEQSSSVVSYNLNVTSLHSSDTVQTPSTLLISSVRRLLQVEQRAEFIQMHLNSILKIAGAQCPQTDEKRRVNLEYSLTSVVLRQQSAPLQEKAITISLTACRND